MLIRPKSRNLKRCPHRGEQKRNRAEGTVPDLQELKLSEFNIFIAERNIPTLSGIHWTSKE